MSLDRRASAALAITLLLWASAFVGIRVALPGFGAAALAVGRLAVASLALVVAAGAVGVRRPRNRDLPRIAACGLAGMTAYQLLLNAGERTVPAGTASLLVATAPVVSAVLAAVVLGEQLSGRGWVGTAIGFAGAAVVILAQSGGHGSRPSIDALLVLGAAVAQASFFVLQQPLLRRYGSLEVTCYATWVGTLLALPLLPSLLADLPQATAGQRWSLVALGVGPSAIGFVTWAYGQARVPVAVAAASLYLVPLLATAIGWLALGETARPAALAGGFVAIAGVVLTRSGSRKDEESPAADDGTARLTIMAQR